MNREQAQAILSKAFEQVRGQLDAIQVFATFRNELGQTEMLHSGEGNYYARRGMIAEYMEQCDEKSRIEERAR